MKFVLFFVISLIAGTLSLLPAASLKDVLNTSKVHKVEVKALAEGKLNDVVCTINDAVLCEVLNLPDAMSSGKKIEPTQDDQVILVVSGKFLNKGSKQGSPDMPQFLSSDNKQYEGKKLYYQGVKKKGPFIRLNPDEEYKFVIYYYLPVTAILNGKLLLKENDPFSETKTIIELNLNENSEIINVHTKKGITDNLFDV